MTEERDEVVIVCLRRSQMPVPPVPSRSELCEECGAPVWVDMATPHDAVVCLLCHLNAGGDLPGELHPEARKNLLRRGYSEAEIDARAARNREAVRDWHRRIS